MRPGQACRSASLPLSRKNKEGFDKLSPNGSGIGVEELDRAFGTTQFRGMTLAGFPRIAVDNAICGGRPTVAGTRVRVSDILEMLAGGASEAEIVSDFPYVTTADIRACLAYAASAADHPVVIAAE